MFIRSVHFGSTLMLAWESHTRMPMRRLRRLLKRWPRPDYQYRFTCVAAEAFTHIGQRTRYYPLTSGVDTLLVFEQFSVMHRLHLTRHVCVTVRRYYVLRAHITARKQPRCRWWRGQWSGLIRSSNSIFF